MASANHLKALVKSYLDRDEQRFYSVALQVAAHEAKLGHGQLAEEIRALIDEAKERRGTRPGSELAIPISRARGDLAGLLAVSYPKNRLSDMVLDGPLAEQLKRIVREQRHAPRILEHGLTPRRKLLLIGPPGTGKTLTAAVLSGELGVPLLQVRLDALLTKFMGEAAAKLRQIFDATGQTRGVYFFDEFDAIGSQRGLINDVGEIRRVLNSFLLMIEQDGSNSLIIAATNHPEILDHALFRRFDDVLHYSLPTTRQIASLLKSRLAPLGPKSVAWASLAKVALGLSYAEVNRAAGDVQKEALIRGSSITVADIRRVLVERQDIAGRLKKTS